MTYPVLVKNLADIPLSEVSHKTAAVAPSPGSFDSSVGHVLADRFLQYGVPSIAAGGGAAIVMKVLSDIQQNQNDLKARKESESSTNSFEVRLPAPVVKKASGMDRPAFLGWRLAEALNGEAPKVGFLGGESLSMDATPTHWAASLPADVAMSTIPGIAAYMVLDKVFKNREKAELEKSIGGIKEDYSGLLLRDIERQRAALGNKKSKVASVDPVEALIDGIVEMKYAGLFFKDLETPRKIVVDYEDMGDQHIADVIREPRALTRLFVPSDGQNSADALMGAMGVGDMIDPTGKDKEVDKLVPGVAGSMLQDFISKRRYRATDQSRDDNSVMQEKMVQNILDEIAKEDAMKASMQDDEQVRMRVRSQKAAGLTPAGTPKLKMFYFQGRKAGISAASEAEAREKLKAGGEDLRLQKVAEQKEAETPLSHKLTGIPVLLTLLAGIASHRYSLNKERDVDEYYSRVGKKNVRPPTRVKLVSAPVESAATEPTAAQQEKQQQPLIKTATGTNHDEHDQSSKKASILAPGLLGLKVYEMAANAKPTGIKAELAAQESTDLIQQDEQQHELARTMPIDQVDSNTILLNTPEGQIVVDATDPGSLKYLQENQQALLDSLNSVNAG
jgi:hypothetical protein